MNHRWFTMEEINGKKVYAPSLVKAYFPKEAGAKAGKWVEITSKEQLAESFAKGLELIRYECEKYDKVIKVRDNPDAIRMKFASLVATKPSGKGYSVDFATAIVCKDFADNCTKWIPHVANESADGQTNLSGWGTSE